jgi:acyl-CoA synthetase (AMP-forming)/AMP-acid ligase II
MSTGRPVTIGAILRDLASEQPERVAIRDPSNAYTYRQLSELSLAAAHNLVDAGLRPGQVVAWLSPSSADFIVMYFATALAGLRILPLNPRLALPELDSVIALTAPAMIVGSELSADLVDGLVARHGITRRYAIDRVPLPAGWQRLMELYRSPASGVAVAPTLPATAHELLLTSGTTGHVKVVERSQGVRLAESLMAMTHTAMTTSTHQLRLSPQFHMGGIIGPYQTILAGGTATIGTFAPDIACHGIRDGATFIAAVPAQYTLLIQAPEFAGVDASAIAFCSFGGSPSNQSDLRRIQEAFANAQLLQVYGSTEAGLVATSHGADFRDHLTSVGLPFPGVDVLIADDEGQPVAPGEIGELLVRSPYTMSGYYGRPDLTDQAFREGFLRMGDLARQDGDGRLYLAGRGSDMIITGGENVHPQEVEDVLLRHPSIDTAVVFSRQDDVFQERVAAVVTIRPNGPSLMLDDLGRDLVGQARASLANFKVPREIYRMPAIPRNASGKVDRRALADLVEAMERIY